MRVLDAMVTGAYLVLVAVLARDWRAGRDRSRGRLVVALGLIGLVSILVRVADALGDPLGLVSYAAIVGLLGSGYALLLFRHSFVPLSPGVRRAALAACAATFALAVASNLPVGPDRGFTPLRSAAVVLFALVWAAMLAEPIVALWRAARDRPAVQRARLRTLSAGYAGIMLAVAIGLLSAPTGRHRWIEVAVPLIGLTVVPLLYVAFLPPRWLRRAWRQIEEEALTSSSDAVLLAPDRATLATRAVEWSMRLLGADGGLLVDRRGNELARIGSVPAEASRAARRGAAAGPWLFRLEGAPARHAAVVPMHFDEGVGALVLVSGPLTPLFGSDELGRLSHYAASIATALDRARLEGALSRETKHTQVMLQAMSDLGEGYVITRDGRAIDVNRAYEEITGYGRDELVGMSLVDLAVPEDRPALADRGRHRLSGRPEPERYETRLMRKDGTVIDVEVAVKLLGHDGAGGVQMASLVRDITERKRAEAEVRASRELLVDAQRVAHLGSFEWEVDSDRLTWSEEMHRIFGVDPASFTASLQGYLQRVHPDDRDRVAGAIRRALEGGRPFVFDHRIVRGDGAVRSLHCRGQVEAGADGRAARMFGTAQDVTERVRAEEALRAAYERERQAADELRALNELKNEFLTAVSHELRTPLTAVRGFANTLEGAEDRLSEEQRHTLLGRLSANAVRLDRLLSDILDLDRLRRGMVRAHRHPTDLPALVRRVVTESDATDGRTVNVAAEPCVIAVDPAKVERIVENLLSNAARHTPADAVIWVGVRAEGDGALLVVEDAGPGVPPELREALFEPFRQGPTESGRAQGVGIGLSLVARFAELHGGRAWVEERRGGGASFRVHLPDGPAEELPATTEPAGASRSA